MKNENVPSSSEHEYDSLSSYSDDPEFCTLIISIVEFCISEDSRVAEIKKIIRQSA